MPLCRHETMGAHRRGRSFQQNVDQSGFTSPSIFLESRSVASIDADQELLQQLEASNRIHPAGFGSTHQQLELCYLQWEQQ